MARRPSLGLRVSAAVLSLALAVGLTGCGGGHSRLRAGALPAIVLERLPGKQGTASLERVVVTRGVARVEAAPQAAQPSWRVLRQLVLSKAQEKQLARDARMIHKLKKPGSVCAEGRPGPHVPELLIQVGARQSLCPPATARPLITFLGSFIPASASA